MAGVEQYSVKPPSGMLMEVTHRCPLHCLYCSNPLEMAKQEAELETEEWLRVLDEAAELGVLQVHFSGGEPLLRRDLLPLLERAAELGMFTNLITSGVGLSKKLMAELERVELGCFQLSLQGADPQMIEEIAGGPFWKKKMEAAQMVRELGISLTVNAVLHAKNLHQTGELIDIAAQMGADEIELANTQYYGWALLNRDHLMPAREQLERASREVEDRRHRYQGRMEIIWVVLDYYDDFPKPCMGGWGDSLLTVAPDGTVMPCLAANVIPDLDLPSVKDQSLRSIWYESGAFNAFRGLDWMEEPCRSCPMRFEDFGGCRCQAYLLAGSATATDPVCIYSPHRDKVLEARQTAEDGRSGSPIYRTLDGVPGS
jgi:pyrroloquinoline quinone biosynthesis protein E